MIDHIRTFLAEVKAVGRKPELDALLVDLLPRLGVSFFACANMFQYIRGDVTKDGRLSDAVFFGDGSTRPVLMTIFGECFSAGADDRFLTADLQPRRWSETLAAGGLSASTLSKVQALVGARKFEGLVYPIACSDEEVALALMLGEGLVLDDDMMGMLMTVCIRSHMRGRDLARRAHKAKALH